MSQLQASFCKSKPDGREFLLRFYPAVAQQAGDVLWVQQAHNRGAVLCQLFQACKSIFFLVLLLASKNNVYQLLKNDGWLILAT